MKCTIPEISWHNRDPVLSVDIQPKCNENEDFRRLATGGTDSHVLIWHIRLQENGAVVVEFAADLTRHQRAVNVVRFSPSGEFLASGDDESAIIVWKQRSDLDCPEFPGGESDGAKEQWLSVKVLRGHIDDVYDLSWSPDSRSLASGSVDNEAILWDVHRGNKTASLSDHKGFVQGVAWDPKNQLVATLCSDRKCRVFGVRSKKIVSRTARSMLPVPEGSPLHGVQLHLYHDDTFKSFFRRLCFSPDGNLLFTPSGFIEEPAAKISCYATYVYSRRNLRQPCAYLPSNAEYTIAVRCCPMLYELREGVASVFDLPYRMVVAVAEQKSVVLYDTQQSEPFAVISNIHYTRLTDLTWSSDGRLLIISSTDGYCSIVSFTADELGIAYVPKPGEADPIRQQFATPKKSLFKEQRGPTPGSRKTKTPSSSSRKKSLIKESKSPIKADEEDDSLGVEIIGEVTTPKAVVVVGGEKDAVSTTEDAAAKPVRRITPLLVSAKNRGDPGGDERNGKSPRAEGKEHARTEAGKNSSTVEDSRPLETTAAEKGEGFEERMEVTTVDGGKEDKAVAGVGETEARKEEASVMEVDVESAGTQSCRSKTPEVDKENVETTATPETQSVKETSEETQAKEDVRITTEGTQAQERMEVTPPEDGATTGETEPASPGKRPPATPEAKTPAQVSPTKTVDLVTPTPVTPKDERRTPRRIGLITISSPKSKKNLLG